MAFKGKAKIYCWCVPAQGFPGDVAVCAVCEDGACLAQHISSGANWAQHDIGITSDWKHDLYQAYCPDGYEVIWCDDPKSPEVQEVLQKNRMLAEAAGADV